jgi:Catalytic LigB subunit of aromatic ring-opening dioxygenase
VGAVLGLGLSHFPGFLYPDAGMPLRVKQALAGDRLPLALRDPDNWPAAMRSEWADDEGAASAREHRAAFVGGVRCLRAALDAFAPDAVLVFGDDQYENFREDLLPPFCLYLAPAYTARPFLRGRAGPPQPNVWAEPPDQAFEIAGHPALGRHLARALLRDGFDLPCAYTVRHEAGLSHAFINTVLYLDYDRRGWPYPLLPFHVNAYGAALVRQRAASPALFGSLEDPDPPAPSPRRCFELGQAIARALRASPWRVAVVGSSSWSHATLTARHHHLYPDVAADRARFAELAAGDYLAWRDLDPDALLAAGQHELLNWLPLVGAMYELRQPPAWCELVETHLMNSCKCVALFPPT